MIDTLSIKWTKLVASSTDARGHRLETADAGWPKLVRGDWQDRDGKAVPGGGGVEVTLDAVFYSESFHGGAVGDIAESPSGVRHRCVRILTRRRDGGSIDHIEYHLQRASPPTGA